jgi:hypothetical protein
VSVATISASSSDVLLKNS